MRVTFEEIGETSKKTKKTNTLPANNTQNAQTGDLSAAIAEEKRRKKIKENKELINEAQKASEEISDSNNKLISALEMLNKSVTGEVANNIKAKIQNVQGKYEKIVNELNTIGTKAAQNVETQGEPCAYDKKQLDSAPLNNGKGEKTFSCNTDVLRRRVLPLLKKLAKPSRTIEKGLPKLKSNDSKDATNILNLQDGAITLITAAYTAIESLTERAEQAEAENKNIVQQLSSGAKTTTTFATKAISAINATIKKSPIVINKALERIRTQGVGIWKDGVEYTFKSSTVTVNGKKYTYYMMEPKNLDPNIPTLFCLDGDGQSTLAGISNEYMQSLATTNGSPWEQTLTPFSSINMGGLDKPNIRFVYIPNPSYAFRTCAMSSSEFYQMIDQIIEQSDNKIDINNMSILGHSARRKSRCTVCEWNRNWRKRTKTRNGT